MKAREFNLNGRTNATGGLLIANQPEMTEFFKSWPNKKIIGTFHIFDPGTSEALKGYYFLKIVPDFRRALWEAGDRKTMEDTETFLRELCPIMRNETPDFETGNYFHELRTVADLDNQELVHYIEHLKQIAAEEFYFVIDDPQTMLE